MPDGTIIDLRDSRADGLPEKLQGCAHIYRDVTGTEAVTKSPTFSARWDVSDPEVTEYMDGMMVQILVPVDGNDTCGTVLQINKLGYKPVVVNVNTGIGTRYPAGSVVIASYNSQQTAEAYLGSGAKSVDVEGCWQVMDSDSKPTKVSELENDTGYITSADVVNDKHYEYEWVTPVQTITVTHNLGKKASVSVVDTANSEIICDVEYIDNNSVKLKFSAATRGTAYFN